MTSSVVIIVTSPVELNQRPKLVFVGFPISTRFWAKRLGDRQDIVYTCWIYFLSHWIPSVFHTVLLGDFGYRV